MKRVSILLLCMIAAGCVTHNPRSMSEEEILERYGDVPIIPDGMAWMIDDMNRERGIEDNADYAQAFQSDLTQGRVALMTVKQIDKGDIATARRMLLTSVNLNVGFLPVYQKRAEIEAKTLADAKIFAIAQQDKSSMLDLLVDEAFRGARSGKITPPPVRNP